MGFFGVECYDLMHYLGQVMVELGLRVLMLDKSDTKSLSCTIPGEFIEKDYVTYLGIDFCTAMDLEEVATKADAVYDIILVDFGFQHADKDIKKCSEMYLVTDYQLHHIMRMKELQLSDEVFRLLVIRDRVSTKLSPDYVIEELQGLNLTQDVTLLLEDTLMDLETKLLCQYDSTFSFRHVSHGFKEFILQVLSIDFDRRTVENAYKVASRRRVK